MTQPFKQARRRDLQQSLIRLIINGIIRNFPVNVVLPFKILASIEPSSASPIIP